MCWECVGRCSSRRCYRGYVLNPSYSVFPVPHTLAIESIWIVIDIKAGVLSFPDSITSYRLPRKVSNRRIVQDHLKYPNNKSNVPEGGSGPPPSSTTHCTTTSS